MFCSSENNYRIIRIRIITEKNGGMQERRAELENQSWSMMKYSESLKSGRKQQNILLN